MKNLVSKVYRIFFGLVVVGGALGVTSESASAAFRLRGLNVASTMSEQDVTDLNEFSVNAVRYQIGYGEIANTLTEEEYFERFNNDLDHLDELIPVYRAARIGIILDVHSPPGGFSNPNPPLPQMRIFAEKWAQDAIVRLWDQVALRYKDNDVIIAYQLVSEPATGKRSAPGLLDWYDLQRLLGKTIRKHDKKKYLVVSAAYSDPTKLDKVRFPRQLGKALHCINFYYPIDFLRQGVELPVNSQDYPTKRFTKKSIEKQLSKTIQFQKKNKALIYVAEFTSSRFGPPGSDVRYLTDILNVFEKYKWSWTYHAWREALVWSIEHAGTDPKDPTKSPTRTGRGITLETYFSRNPLVVS